MMFQKICSKICANAIKGSTVIWEHKPAQLFEVIGLSPSKNYVNIIQLSGWHANCLFIAMPEELKVIK